MCASDYQKLRGEDQARSGLVFSLKVKSSSFLVWCLALFHFTEWLKHGCPVRKRMIILLRLPYCQWFCYYPITLLSVVLLLQEQSELDNTKMIVAWGLMNSRLLQEKVFGTIFIAKASSVTQKDLFERCHFFFFLISYGRLIHLGSLQPSAPPVLPAY